MIPIKAKLKVQSSQVTFPLKVSSNNVPLSIKSSTVIQKISGDKYEGDYVITPSSEVQTLHTSLLSMTDDVTINPIPSNYGLITWDGSTLLVS